MRSRYVLLSSCLLACAASLPGCGGNQMAQEGADGGAAMPGAGSAGAGGSATGAAGGAPNGGTQSGGGSSPGGSGGTTSAGTAGMAGSASGSAGAAGALGGSGGGGGSSAPGCGSTVSVNLNPFGCTFAWGANGDSGNRSSYLQFITSWIGYEPFPPNNRPNDCDGCGLVSDLASTTAVPVFYAYYIGYGATADGYGDCNTDPNQDLCTHGAQWIREHRQQIIDFYASYAAKAYQANRNKPVVWLLDGDFMQYTEATQTQRLSVAELGTLANDITCAIKTSAPNAVVAINHTPWNANTETEAFLGAVNLSILDMVWTTGVGNNGGLINEGAAPDEYNEMTARYSYIHQRTGKTLFVDTSFGVSQQDDSWSTASAATLNQRIAEGVVAANVTQPPSNYQARVASFGSQLASTCQ